MTFNDNGFPILFCYKPRNIADYEHTISVKNRGFFTN